jgi:restriction system protein
MFSSLKGWVGEQLTTFGMWLRLDENTYRRIDDIILPSNNGTTQIDHVLVSIYGIFVIETKNLQGWIFGSENDATWCQSIYGHKTRFQNPLRQNHRHVECLVQFLGLERALFHSIVFFIGECEFKTTMPAHVLCSGLGNYVERFRNPLLGLPQVAEIESRLRDLKANSGVRKSDHLASLEHRHTSATTCPKCGGKLVQRTARQTGKRFIGCSNFPKCRHTVWPK